MTIEKEYARFPDVHPHIVLKTDILRQGIALSGAALDNFRKRNDLCWKGFHLFSYDHGKTKLYHDKIPATIHLEDGCPIQTRTNERSPYTLDLVDGEFVIEESDAVIARKLYFARKPRWYDMKTEDGVAMSAIAQGNGRMIFVTMNKFCEIWKANDQCLFCNINTTLTDQKKGGEDFVARIDPETIAEVIKTALHVDHHSAWLYITGGTILKTYQGQTEIDFYVTRLNAIREKLQVWIPTTVQIAAQNDEGWRRLHETGFGSVQPNMEVWDKSLFRWICPGKEKYIGYDAWVRRTIRAVDFWGRGRVNPSFVLGVEMAKPHGFERVSEALGSTLGGWDFLMGEGVLPRFNLWTVEYGSAFHGQQTPPLEYFIEAQKGYTELRWKHKFDPPFPAGHDRFTYRLNCLQDFEYYHGSSTLSKRRLDANLGVTPGEEGGYEDMEGYAPYPRRA